MNFISLYAGEIAEGLERGTYRSNPLVPKNKFDNLYESYNETTLSDSRAATRRGRKYQAGTVNRSEMNQQRHILSNERLY